MEPEKIAHELFTNEPKAPNSCQLLADVDVQDKFYIYEILMTILLEGFDVLTGGLDGIKPSMISPSHFTNMNKWFNSIGFNISIKSSQKVNEEEYQEYYCKIIIKDASYEFFFNLKNIQKNYHFFLNPKYINKTQKVDELKNIYAIFVSDYTVYQISFDHCI